ncbi:hypothetical protein [Embleya sp. NPDC059259]|uniref:hypothetical protein n=1 Tax=unclassified Embleya TaxID=2699296 RepID=UPI0036CDF5FF
MLRIKLTSEDLVRTRIAATWGPLGETFFSLTTLQQRQGEALFGEWRRRVHAGSAARTHPASALFHEAFLDLFTVTGASTSIEEGLDAMRAARADHLHTELAGAVDSVVAAPLGAAMTERLGARVSMPTGSRGPAGPAMH